jgi:hypothetical protein
MKAGAKLSNSSSYRFFDSDTGAYGYVQLNRPELVSISSLEFCVFDTEGHARLSTSEPASPLLLPTWVARHKRLIKQAKKLLEDDHDKEANPGLASRLGCFDGHLFKLALERGGGS